MIATVAGPGRTCHMWTVVERVPRLGGCARQNNELARHVKSATWAALGGFPSSDTEIFAEVGSAAIGAAHTACGTHTTTLI